MGDYPLSSSQNNLRTILNFFVFADCDHLRKMFEADSCSIHRRRNKSCALCFIFCLLYGIDVHAQEIPAVTHDTPTLGEDTATQRAHPVRVATHRNARVTSQNTQKYTSQDYLRKLFEKYGENGVMSFEAFEHMLHNLGLGGLGMDHGVEQHFLEGSYRDMHDPKHIHSNQQSYGLEGHDHVDSDEGHESHGNDEHNAHYANDNHEQGDHETDDHDLPGNHDLNSHGNHEQDDHDSHGNHEQGDHDLHDNYDYDSYGNHEQIDHDLHSTLEHSEHDESQATFSNIPHGQETSKNDDGSYEYRPVKSNTSEAEFSVLRQRGAVLQPPPSYQGYEDAPTSSNKQHLIITTRREKLTRQHHREDNTEDDILEGPTESMYNHTKDDVEDADAVSRFQSRKLSSMYPVVSTESMLESSTPGVQTEHQTKRQRLNIQVQRHTLRHQRRIEKRRRDRRKEKKEMRRMSREIPGSSAGRRDGDTSRHSITKRDTWQKTGNAVERSRRQAETLPHSDDEEKV